MMIFDGKSQILEYLRHRTLGFVGTAERDKAKADDTFPYLSRNTVRNDCLERAYLRSLKAPAGAFWASMAAGRQTRIVPCDLPPSKRSMPKYSAQFGGEGQGIVTN